MIHKKNINEINCILYCIFFACGILLFSDKAHSNEKFEVLWGGLGYATSGEDSTSPVAEILRQCSSKTHSICQNAEIEKTAKQYFTDIGYDRIELSVGTVKVGEITSYLLSPVITTEIVLEAYQGSIGYSYTYIISGNVLIYEIDGSDINYVYSLPVTLLQDEFHKTKISYEEQQKYIADMYLNETRDAGNVFNLMATLASNKAYVPISFSNFIQITKVEFSDEVANILGSTSSISGWEKSLANFASARLAEWSGVPIVPASLGHNKLRFIFSNGLREINLPDQLNYEFEIDVKRFVKQEPESGVVCFMVGTVLSIQSFGDTIFKAPFFHTQDGCIDIPKNATRDPGVYFPINLLSQLDKISKMFDCVNFSNYIHKSIKKNSQEAMEKIKQVCKDAFEKG